MGRWCDMGHGQHADGAFRNKFFEIESRLEDDDGNVLFSVARLEKWLQENAKSIVRWSWILHDEDTYTLDDCINPDDPTPRRSMVLFAAEVWLDVDVRLRIWLYAEWKATRDPYTMRGYFGDLKPIHIHCAVEAKSARSFRQVAKELSVSEGCIQKSTAHFRDKTMKGKQFEAMFTYQSHKEDVQRSKGKHVYPDSAVHTSGFDYTEMLTAYLEAKAKAAADRMGRSEIDEVTNALFAGETTVKKVIATYGYAFYHAHMKAFDDAEQAYLMSSGFEMPTRMTVVVGPSEKFAAAHPDKIGGIGKTALARQTAYGLYPDLDKSDALFEVTDLKVPFDAYLGQPVILIDESRPGALLHEFGRGKLYAMTDPHPGKGAVHKKYGRVLLTNAWLVFTTPHPPR